MSGEDTWGPEPTPAPIRLDTSRQNLTRLVTILQFNITKIVFHKNSPTIFQRVQKILTSFVM